MPVIRSQPARPASGLALAAASAAAFGTSGTFGSSLIGAGWTPGAAVVIRIAVAALVLTGPAARQLRGRWGLLRREAPRVTAYGLTAVAGCQLCYFTAIEHMPVGVALLLEYLGAVLVVGWLWLRHGQRPGRLTSLGSVTAIAGLVMVLNLAGSARISPVGVVWGLLAAAGLACYFLLSAADGGQALPPVAMACAGMWAGAAALGAAGWAGVVPLRATTRNVDLLGHQVSWLIPVLGLSVVAAAFAYVAGIGAARRLGARPASFIGMAEILFAILFAWLLLHQLPSPVQFAGGALILAGVALVRAGEPRGPRAPGQPADLPSCQEAARVGRAGWGDGH